MVILVYGGTYMKIIFGSVIENGKRIRKYLVLEPKTCIVCGELFEPKRQDSKYCSDKCSRVAEYENNKENYKKKSLEYYNNNKEKRSESRKKYYWSDPERFRLATKEYNKLHKEEKNKKDNEYKDKTRHDSKKKLLIDEFGCKCSMCGKEGSTFEIVAHHVTFDKNDHESQVLLCRSCHMRVHESFSEYNKNRVPIGVSPSEHLGGTRGE
jgi:predicted nucleic acid-binding Zn ribbon protein